VVELSRCDWVNLVPQKKSTQFGLNPTKNKPSGIYKEDKRTMITKKFVYPNKFKVSASQIVWQEVAYKFMHIILRLSEFEIFGLRTKDLVDPVDVFRSSGVEVGRSSSAGQKDEGCNSNMDAITSQWAARVSLKI